MSLRSRLLLFVIAVLVPVIGIQAYTEFDLRSDRELELRADAVRQATMFARELQRMIEGAQQLLVAFSETDVLRRSDAEACNQYALRLERRYPQLIDLAAADLDGHVFCGKVDPTVGGSIRDEPYFRQAIAMRDFVLGDLAPARAAGGSSLPIALPFFGTDGQLGGIVFAAFEPAALQEILRDKVLRPEGSLTVTDRDGMILLRHPDAEGWVGHRLPDRFMPRLSAVREGAEVTTGLDGLRRIDGYIPPRHPLAPGLMVSVGLSIDEAFGTINEASRRAVLLDGGALLLALVAAWPIGHYAVRRPMAVLVQAASRLAQGDYAARTHLALERGGEFGRIGAAFDAMAVALERHERELRDANLFKSRVLAIAAHDLRQPLQVIIGAYEWLVARASAFTSDREHRLLRQADRAADRLAHQIELLASAVHLEVKGMQPQLETEQVGALFSEVAELFGPQAEAKRIDLRVLRPRALVRTDLSMLQTILHNLVSNAIKYTEPGGVILVGCRRRGNCLAMQVHDTGIGIPEDQSSAIFATFHRVDATREDGLGLGLSIVKRTAEMLGYRLHVRSVVGRGSCFELEVPLAKVDATDEGA